MKKKPTSTPVEETEGSVACYIIVIIMAVGMSYFLAKTGYDPFPMCTCGDLSTDSVLLNRAAQGDTLIKQYLATESSDLMCAARKKALLEALEQRAQGQKPVDN